MTGIPNKKRLGLLTYPNKPREGPAKVTGQTAQHGPGRAESAPQRSAAAVTPVACFDT